MRNKKWIIQILIFSTVICMVSYGLYRGEASIVFNKAINICLECIGLG